LVLGIELRTFLVLTSFLISAHTYILLGHIKHNMSNMELHIFVFSVSSIKVMFLVPNHFNSHSPASFPLIIFNTVQRTTFLVSWLPFFYLSVVCPHLPSKVRFLGMMYTGFYEVTKPYSSLPLLFKNNSQTCPMF
jgi:hypothetical protein